MKAAKNIFKKKIDMTHHKMTDKADKLFRSRATAYLNHWGGGRYMVKNINMIFGKSIKYTILL